MENFMWFIYLSLSYGFMIPVCLDNRKLWLALLLAPLVFPMVLGAVISYKLRS